MTDQAEDDCACAVSLCGNEGKIVPICANGHVMHLECLKGWVKNREEPSCPKCRDPYLTEMKAFFEDNPYIHQPPSPGPSPNPYDFGQTNPLLVQPGDFGQQGRMDHLLLQAYLQRQQIVRQVAPRFVTTTRTVQNIPGGYMHVETVHSRSRRVPALMNGRPLPRRQPRYFLPQGQPFNPHRV